MSYMRCSCSIPLIRVHYDWFEMNTIELINDDKATIRCLSNQLSCQKPQGETSLECGRLGLFLPAQRPCGCETKFASRTKASRDFLSYHAKERDCKSIQFLSNYQIFNVNLCLAGYIHWFLCLFCATNSSSFLNCSSLGSFSSLAFILFLLAFSQLSIKYSLILCRDWLRWCYSMKSPTSLYLAIHLSSCVILS